ncbi:hypothetical protein FRC12_010110 [Ceratobasidium sp. 428]|nr:hypothetical protein FRC09_001071 [Ceratobasidium sp. 395]KAG8791125.1 hypothetical protein FRC12_010110 [Ceratobasidium sp. 428]
MDIDPLQDAPPARYAVESDSEDEIGFYPGPKPVRTKRTYHLDLKLDDGIGTENVLIVACGPAGISWAGGLDGRAVGSLVLNDVEVGEYRLTALGILVLVISHRLPLGAEYIVARAIVEKQTGPKPIVVIDSYSYLAYISSQPIRSDSYPVRFLQTSPSSAKLPAQPYAPPNLLQHLPAALLAECEYLEKPAVALLVPVRLIPPPAPAEPTAYSTASEEIVSDVVSLDVRVAKAIGIEVEQLSWDAARVKTGDRSGKSKGRRKSGDIGEGGMYI